MLFEEFVENLGKLKFNISNTPPKETKYSIKKFLNKELPTYLSIRIGKGLEKLCKELVQFFPEFELLEIGLVEQSELDVIYISHKLKEIYYFEIKANIDHDSEKKKATIEKVAKIATHIKNNLLYKNYNLNFGVFCPTNVYEQNSYYSKKYNIKLFSLKCFIETLTRSKYSTEDLNQIKNLIIELINKELKTFNL